MLLSRLRLNTRLLALRVVKEMPTPLVVLVVVLVVRVVKEMPGRVATLTRSGVQRAVMVLKETPDWYVIVLSPRMSTPPNGSAISLDAPASTVVWSQYQ